MALEGAGRTTGLVVLGGGAAGLMAGLRAAEALGAPSAAHVVVLEAAREAGRKVVISGGGRCNLLPRWEAPSRFVSSAPPRLVRRFLDRWPLSAQRAFFEELLGGPLREEGEKLFPPSNRSRDVRDALVARAREASVDLRTGAVVVGVERTEGGFRVATSTGPIEAGAVVLATGGHSVLAGGADGAGLEWARHLGHRVRPVFPALVPLVAEGAPHSVLAGLSVDASVRAEAEGERATASGGFLFTHKGYSGPAALNVAHVVARAGLAGTPFRVSASFGEAAEWDERLRSASGSAVALLKRHFPDRLADLLVTASGSRDVPLHRLSRERRRALVETITAFPLPVSGTEGYRTAEVTGGGVALEEVDPGSGESRLVPGLFLAGEILDAFGPIGGFNFQWAWATGRTAGEAAGRRLQRRS